MVGSLSGGSTGGASAYEKKELKKLKDSEELQPKEGQKYFSDAFSKPSSRNKFVKIQD